MSLSSSPHLQDLGFLGQLEVQIFSLTSREVFYELMHTVCQERMSRPWSFYKSHSSFQPQKYREAQSEDFTHLPQFSSVPSWWDQCQWGTWLQAGQDPLPGLHGRDSRAGAHDHWPGLLLVHHRSSLKALKSRRAWWLRAGPGARFTA